MEPQKLPLNKLTKQLEFYFEPINVDTDRFLRLCIQATPNGYVPISTLQTFNLIRSNSREEIVEAAKVSTKVELSQNEAELRSVIPYQKNENLRDHMIYLFNPKQESNHSSIKASILEKGGPVPIKVGCKRDNETGNCYGAKLYFRTLRDTDEFIDKFMRDEKGLIKDITTEKDVEGGLARYSDYSRMMKDLSESRKECLMMLSGLKGYDLKNQKNVIKTMIKRELNEQEINARNVMITEKECTKCLIIFVSKEKVEETKTKDLNGLKIDGSPVQLTQLTAVEVDDILREIGEKRQAARDRGVSRPFQRNRRGRGGGRRMGRGVRGRGAPRGGMGRGGPRGGQRGGYSGSRGGYGNSRGDYGGDRGGQRGGYGNSRGGYGNSRGGYGGDRGSGYAPRHSKRANTRGGYGGRY